MRVGRIDRRAETSGPYERGFHGWRRWNGVRLRPANLRDVLDERHVSSIVDCVFGGDGLFIDALDMSPCTSESDSDCLSYPTPSNYLLALEVQQGELQRFGVGEEALLH